MSDLTRQLNDMRVEAYAAQAARRAEDERRQRGLFGDQEDRRECLLSQLRPMQRWEYDAWLTGFMLAGGKPTHFYEYPMPIEQWYTAWSDLSLVPLYGSFAISVFVPADVRVLGGETGHTNLYIATDEGAFLYQGFHYAAPRAEASFVPVYTDTEVLA